MSKRNKQSKQQPAVVSPVVESPVESSIQAKGALRLPLAQAKAHNLAHTLLAVDQPVVGANVALTAKGTNPSKVRVYGYDNLGNGGKVPKAATVQVVPGITGAPKGVAPAQWDKLVAMAGKSVSHLYDNG